MKRVLKWSVPVDDYAHAIGTGKVLYVGCQAGPDQVQVWTEEGDTPHAVRPVRVFGTGHPIPDQARYVGSAFAAGGMLVWHVYEVMG